MLHSINHNVKSNKNIHDSHLSDESKIHIVVCLVSTAFGLFPQQIHSHSRGTKRIAFARQIAMYILHVWLGLSLSEIGRRFGRDRTTVAYACRNIEDQRDNPQVDKMLEIMEASASTWQEFAIELRGRFS